MKALGRFFDGIVNLWESEPVAVTGLVTVLLDAAVAFGAPIADGQKQAVVAVFSALGIVIARHQATSMAAPNLPVGTIVNDGAGVVVKV